MATQQEVLSYIKSNFNHSDLGDSVITMRFDVGNDRSQMVIVHVMESLIATASPFARVGQITDSQALDASTIMAPVSRTEEFYVTSKSMALETIDAEEIHSILALTCIMADQLEKHFGLEDEF